MTGIQIGDPHAESPPVSAAWRDQADNWRLQHVRHGLGILGIQQDVNVVEAAKSGRITVELRRHLSAAERGEKLRRFEDWINRNVATGLQVFVKPEIDRNRLRQLRGVRVKDA